MQSQSIPCHPGLDNAGQRIVHQRWQVCCTHIEQWLTRCGLWEPSLLTPSSRGELVERLETCRTLITHDNSKEYVKQENGWDEWQRDYLLPLAHDLKIWELEHEFTWKHCFYKCWNSGFFDVPLSRHKPLQRKRPHIEKCHLRVQTVFQEHSSAHARMKALVDQGLCSDDSLAASAVAQLSLTDSEAAQKAWEILYAALTDSQIYLLKYSTCKYVGGLLFLQRDVTIIERMSDTPVRILTRLRTAIIALYQALTSSVVIQTLLVQKGLPTDIPKLLPKTLTKQEREQYKQAQYILDKGLWREDLLHRPPHDPERQAFLQQFTPNLQSIVITQLEVRLKHDREQAAIVFETFGNTGIPGLVNLFCQIQEGQTARTFTIQRIRASLDVHLSWLNVTDRHEVERLIITLQDTVDALRLPIPLFPLVDTYPGNECRKHFKRWLKEHPQIIDEFARRAALLRDDASARLYAFSSYGGLGILRLKHERLYGIIESGIVRYIHFQKLAHIQEVQLSVLTDRVNALARILDKQTFSPQVIRALLNHLKKEDRWNNGSGHETDFLYTRASPYLPHVPRLHKAWVLVVTKLNIPVVDESTSQIFRGCFITLVLDHDSVLPMGCWVSIQEPNSSDMGLAIYQAIWHVGSVWWPIRGAPEAIHIPLQSLKSTEESLESLRKAAYFIPTEVVADVRERHWQRQRLVRDLRTELPVVVQRTTGNAYATAKQVQDATLTWLYQARLSLHRASNGMSGWWNPGFAMPGYDSPAAGWLLPISGSHLHSTVHGVVLGINTYTSPTFHAEPGLSLPYRIFPYYYPALERGIFIEHKGNLHYLIRNE